jgi:hypothetical protein|eukprot:SAG25_NODE_3304_length_1138_cov_1.049086_3_plen_65_part_00
MTWSRYDLEYAQMEQPAEHLHHAANHSAASQRRPKFPVTDWLVPTYLLRIMRTTTGACSSCQPN